MSTELTQTIEGRSSIRAIVQSMQEEVDRILDRTELFFEGDREAREEVFDVDEAIVRPVTADRVKDSALLETVRIYPSSPVVPKSEPIVAPLAEALLESVRVTSRAAERVLRGYSEKVQAWNEARLKQCATEDTTLFVSGGEEPSSTVAPLALPNDHTPSISSSTTLSLPAINAPIDVLSLDASPLLLEESGAEVCEYVTELSEADMRTPEAPHFSTQPFQASSAPVLRAPVVPANLPTEYGEGLDYTLTMRSDDYKEQEANEVRVEAPSVLDSRYDKERTHERVRAVRVWCAALAGLYREFRY